MPLLGTRGTSSLRSFGFAGGRSGPGQIEYTIAGTYTWVAQADVSSVSVVAIGGGSAGTWGTGGYIPNGGGGGGLGWKNNITVTPGGSYTVVVGVGGTGSAFSQTAPGDSYFINATTVKGGAAGLASGGGGVGGGAG
jgi:hypothetical protein